MEENIHYLYRHIRLDTNEVFYVGIGTRDKLRSGKRAKNYRRAETKELRSDWWKRIIAKTEYEVEIMLESDDYDFIKQKEIEFIALYGRKDLGKGSLCNLTDGGEGTKGVVVSDETKIKMSFKRSGEGSHMFGKKHTQESIQKMREATIPLYGKNNPASQRVINTLTLETYDSASEAAKYMRYDIRNFRRWVLGTRSNPTYFLYLRDYKGEIHYPEKRVVKIPLLDLDTGIIYENVQAACNSLNYNHQPTLDKINGKSKNTTSLIKLSEYLDRKLM